MGKKDNRFQFVSFLERISRINVDLIRRHHHASSVPSDEETFFAENFAKFTQEEGSNQFADFTCELPKMENLKTYIQLLHFQKDVASTIQNHLLIENSPCVPALFDLTVSLARDLQSDFYPYFWSFFDCFVSVMNNNSNDAEILEHGFSALAFLFKILWRQMLKEMKLTFRRFMPLFSHKKPYFRRFCAEAFGFLMRKCKRPMSFLRFVISSLASDNTLIEGVAQLLFQSVKGVKFQFHSIAENLIDVLFKVCLEKKAPERSTAAQLLCTFTRNVVVHTSREFAGPVCEVYLKCLESERNDENVMLLLDLHSIWLEYHSGSVFPYAERLISILLALFETVSLSVETSDKLLDLVSTVFHLQTFGHEQINWFFRRFLDVSFKGVDESPKLFESIAAFVENNFDLPGIDFVLLTSMGKLSEVTPELYQERILLCYQKLILKRRPIAFGSELNKSELLPFLDCKVHSRIREWTENNITNWKRHLVENEILKVIYSVVLWPWFSRSVKNVNNVEESLVALLDFILTNPRSESNRSTLLWLTGYCLSLKNAALMVSNNFDTVIHHIQKFPVDVGVLRFVDLYFWTARHEDRSDILSEQHLYQIVKVLDDAISSPLSTIRKSALEILCAFPIKPKQPENEISKEPVPSVFEICLKAEQIPLTIQQYRARLFLLRKLSYGSVWNHLPDGGQDILITLPLRCLISQFYENFSLLWSPVTEVIESYARGEQLDLFWKLFSTLLEQANTNANNWLFRNEEKKNEIREEWMMLFDDSAGQDRVDFANFRLQLWRSLIRFADIAEGKTRTLSPLLLRLVNDEYRNVEICSIVAQDLKHLESTETLNDETPEETNIDENRHFDKKETKKTIRKTLLSMLEVFAKFKDPKSVYMEPQIMDLYLELLQQPDAGIQKRVLECVFRYKQKFLTPYRENFERLVDDKSFGDELVLFTIDEQVSVVSADHRSQLIPFLMKILYGKLQARTTGPGGNATIMRRNAIFRFLAGCKSEELLSFLELLFAPVLALIGDRNVSVMETILHVESQICLSHFIPLRKLLMILINLCHVINKLASIIGQYLPLLYKICLVVAKLVMTIAQNKNIIHPKLLKTIKTLRHNVTERFSQFFTTFESYQYTSDELTALFEVWIWPQIGKISTENVYAPTGLVKMFCSLAEIPRYFCLLNVPSEDNTTPLSALFGVLLNANCTQAVEETIMKAVEQLLTLADFEPSDEDGQSLIVPQKRMETRSELINIGTKLILGDLPTLIQYLNKALTCSNRKLKRRDLMILEKISEFVNDPTTCSDLIGLLLNFFEQKVLKSEGIQANALLSVAHLTKNLINPCEYIRRISPLFSQLNFRKSRDALCYIISMAKPSISNEDAKTGLDIIEKLNSWDPKRIDEPNYTLRQDGFSLVLNAIRSENKPEFLSEDIILLFTHSCVFMLESDDMSLRDSARYGLEELIKNLSRWSFPDEFVQLFLNRHLLSAVRMGLKSNLEGIRHDFITLLSIVVQSFPTHSKLSSLHQLIDTSEPDLDFFLNISHIQQHRRIRAIYRLCDQLESKDTATHLHIAIDTLHGYIVPIITPFVLDANYAKNTGLVDEGVRFIGCVAKLSSWKRYLPMLQYYLTKLVKDVNRQKVMIRTVVAILDAFHFDLLSIQTEHKPDIKPRESEIQREIMETDDTQESYSAQRKIYDTVVEQLLPKLTKSLDTKNESELVHKRAGAARHYDEDADILRAPVALAMIKLLQKLPENLLETHLPGILLKLCQLLKSRSKDVREATRKILKNVVETLGPKYLPFVVRNMREVMTRGYQVHVMIYTVHVLLSGMVERLKSGDLDPCLTDILEVCNEEMFGEISEEKEVEEITRHLMEAKAANKTVETYQIVGKFTSLGCLASIIAPLKEVLDTKHSSKVVKKVSEAFKFLAFGLISNSAISVKELMIFIHQTLTEYLPQLFITRKRPIDEEDEDMESPTDPHPLRPVSTYILPPDPGRRGVLPKTSKRSNCHVLVEFALQLLHSSLKAGSLKSETEEDCISLLDPFVNVIVRCLDAKYDKVLSLSLRCLISFMSYELPTLKTDFGKTVERLFLLLNQYAGLGAASAKGDAFELSQMLFKAINTVIRDVSYYSMNSKQAQVIFYHVEQDIFDNQKQATAFSLLKSILIREIVCEGIRSVIRKIEQLAITSHAQHVRVQCRQVMLLFLTHYPLGRNPRKHLEFFLTQITYEFEDGRISSIEMLNTLFEHLPKEVLQQYAALCFVHLSTRLVNDQSSKCRQLIALALRSLLEKVDQSTRDGLFQIVLDWLQDEKAAHQRLSAEVMVQFIECESEKFVNRLDYLLPIFFSKLVKTPEHQSELITVLLNTARNILRLCSEWSEKLNDRNIVNDFLEFVCGTLKFVDDAKVRLAASQLCGQLFSCYKLNDFGERPEMARDFINYNLDKLCENFCWLLRHSETTTELAEQVVKNLVFLSKLLLSRQPLVTKVTEEKELNFEILTNRLSRICQFEVAKNSTSVTKRDSIFKWVAAMALDCDEHILNVMLDNFLFHLHREVKKSNDNPLCTLANEVCEVIKSRIGVENFSKRMAVCQKEAGEKREARKTERAMEAVTNPEKSARRKTKRHQAKVESKKRKIYESKPYKIRKISHEK